MVKQTPRNMGFWFRWWEDAWRLEPHGSGNHPPPNNNLFSVSEMKRIIHQSKIDKTYVGSSGYNGSRSSSQCWILSRWWEDAWRLEPHGSGNHSPPNSERFAISEREAFLVVSALTGNILVCIIPILVFRAVTRKNWFDRVLGIPVETQLESFCRKKSNVWKVKPIIHQSKVDKNICRTFWI